MNTATAEPRHDHYLSAAEAAAMLGIREQTLACWRCTNRHALPFVRVGRSIRYRAADLERWLAARTVGAHVTA